MFCIFLSSVHSVVAIQKSSWRRRHRRVTSFSIPVDSTSVSISYLLTVFSTSNFRYYLKRHVIQISYERKIQYISDSPQILSSISWFIFVLLTYSISRSRIIFLSTSLWKSSHSTSRFSASGRSSSIIDPTNHLKIEIVSKKRGAQVS